MPACLCHSGPHACPHLHTVACPILCCQTWRSRVTCVFVKVRVCVCVCRWLSATLNVTVMLERSLSMTVLWVLLFFGGRERRGHRLLSTNILFPPFLLLRFPGTQRHQSTSRWQPLLTKTTAQLSCRAAGLRLQSKNSALYDFVLFYPWSDDHTTIWMSPHLPDYFSHQPLGFKPRLFLGLDLVFFVCFF